MMPTGPRSAAMSDLRSGHRQRMDQPTYGSTWRSPLARLGQPLTARLVAAVALLLVGAAAGQRMATRAAHQTGACIALQMAGALGYLDAEQRRRVRNALVTAINPDADLFAGLRPSAPEACSAVGGG